MLTIAQAIRLLEILGFVGMVAKSIRDAIATPAAGVELTKEEIVAIRLALSHRLQRLRDVPDDNVDKVLCTALLAKLWDKYPEFEN